MIDNFNLIKSLIDFNEKDELFFYLQIIRRGKDHKNLPSANKVIKDYYIQSASSLDKLKDDIIYLCELFKARAYINVNSKSFSQLAKLAAFKLSERIYNGDVKKIYKIFSSAAGELKSNNQKWIVDIDNMDLVNPVINKIISIWKTCDSEIHENSYYENKIILKVPTKSGLHLITCPFNLLEFKKEFQNVDIHKNNPTVLYIPNSLKCES